MSEPRPRITHKVKIWPEYFNQVRNGRMKFQLRRNDRDFQVGDELLLKEWHETLSEGWKYTGRELLVRVDYIMDPADHSAFGLFQGYVIMSISHVH